MKGISAVNSARQQATQEVLMAAAVGKLNRVNQE